VIKQQKISWALPILGFLIAFGFQVYVGYKPEAEMHNGIYKTRALRALDSF